jgi:mono/diheme cytochrome c family protein
MPQKFVARMLLVSALGLGVAQAAPPSQEVLDKGRQEFETRCKHCHGEKGDGQGHLNAFLKIVPANLTQLKAKDPQTCVAERVLKAVLGRHTTSDEKHKMPLLAEVLTPESIYFLSEYVKSIQQ